MKRDSNEDVLPLPLQILRCLPVETGQRNYGFIQDWLHWVCKHFWRIKKEREWEMFVSWMNSRDSAASKPHETKAVLRVERDLLHGWARTRTSSHSDVARDGLFRETDSNITCNTRQGSQFWWRLGWRRSSHGAVQPPNNVCFSFPLGTIQKGLVSG